MKIFNFSLRNLLFYPFLTVPYTIILCLPTNIFASGKPPNGLVLILFF